MTTLEKQEYARKYQKENKDKIRNYMRRYRRNNREKCRVSSRCSSLKNYHKDKELINAKRRLRYQQIKATPAFKAKEKIRSKKYRDAHKKEARLLRRQWERRQQRTNPTYRINKGMSGGIRQSIKDNKNGRHWEILVGYSIESLKEHLGSLFTEGMTWQNYGKNGWVIDHIIPKSWFEYTSPEDDEFKQCWALCNLQPMWEKDNLAKSNKVQFLSNSLALAQK